MSAYGIADRHGDSDADVAQEDMNARVGNQGRFTFRHASTRVQYSPCGTSLPMPSSCRN